MKQTYNAEIIKVLAKKYEISPRYVRYCLNGDRTPCFAEKIKKDYKSCVIKIQKVLNS